MKLICNGLADTQKFAKEFASSLKGSEVITLNGDLGAGKTTFTQFLAKELGIDAPVTSPTFTLMNQYTEGRLKLYHFDMYRIEDPDELAETGLTEYFGNSDAVCIVEWAENILSSLPKNTIDINITKLGETQREFEVIKKD